MYNLWNVFSLHVYCICLNCLTYLYTDVRGVLLLVLAVKSLPKTIYKAPSPLPAPSQAQTHTYLLSQLIQRRKWERMEKVFFFQQPPQFLLPAEPHKSADELKAFTTTTTNFSQADLKTRSNPVYTWIYKTFEPNWNSNYFLVFGAFRALGES